MYDATHNDKTRPQAKVAARVPALPPDFQAVVLYGNVAAKDTSIAALVREPSGNDAFYALAANSPDAGAPPATTAAAGLTGYELLLATRFERAALLGTLIFAAAQFIAAFSRQALVRLQQRRRMRATYRTLYRLDDSTLRDIGLERSELAPLASELRSEAIYSQVRGTFASSSFPR